MKYLAIVSLVWAFSFGLIGTKLTGIDPIAVTVIRLGIASLLFLPCAKLKQIPITDRLKLVGYGAIQFGMMYGCYIKAFQYLPSHLVALFSVLTPIYVVAIHAAQKREWSSRYLIAATLSVVGAIIIQAKTGTSGSFWLGVVLMQIAGIAFAFGQVYYRDWRKLHPETDDQNVFVLLYMGGAGFALAFSLFATDWSALQIQPQQWLVLLYLGVIASGLGFFLWNKGAVTSSPGALAAFNNAVIPLAMLCSLFIFEESSDLDGKQIIRLVAGGICIFSAVFIAKERHPPSKG
ncbi:MAG: EamA family transporter [Lentimonas sp.]